MTFTLKVAEKPAVPVAPTMLTARSISASVSWTAPNDDTNPRAQAAVRGKRATDDRLDVAVTIEVMGIERGDEPFAP